MKNAFLFLCLVISQLTFAQSKLAGFVTEQNSGKKPVADVLVKSFGANSIEPSSTEGKFLLTFQDLPAGKNVIVRAEKEGWEIVNEKEMSTFIPFNLDEKPLKIILCPAGALAKAKSKYYDTFEENLYSEFNKLKIKYKNNQKELAQLEEDYSRIHKQLEDLADEYSRINLDDATEKELQAIELFKAGKYNEFIALKQSIVTEAQVDKALKNKQEATKIIANSDSTIALYFKSQRDVAKTQILQFDFVGAEKTYENIVSKDTNNYENTVDFAYFLFKQKQNNKAIQYQLKVLKLAKREPDVAMTHLGLGEMYLTKNEYEASLRAYSKALKTYESLDSVTYESDVANTQNSLGNLYKAKKEYEKSFTAYSKALEIYERLAKTYPTTNEPNVAGIQHNLGAFYYLKKDYGASFSAYSKALETYERLAKIYPTTYESALANTLGGLGNLYSVKNEYSEAWSAYSRTLKIFERLAETNPSRFEIEVCRTMVNLGVLQKNDYQPSRQTQINSYLEKAKQILPKYPDIPLAKELMERVSEDLEYFQNSEILSPILILYGQSQKEGKNAEKIKIQEKIIEKYRYLVANGYPQFAYGLGSNLGSLAYYQLLNKEFVNAEKSAKEALNPTTFKKTGDYDTKIEWANTNLALAFLFQGKYAEAEKVYLALKDKPYNNATYRETFLADLEELEKAGITHPDVVKIREILKK